MSPSLVHALRGRWFSLLVHLGLWVLFYLALINLGGKTPDYRDAAASSQPADSPLPVAKLGSLFSTAQWPKIPASTNLDNPFYTLYFFPQPGPPSTTQKIEVSYQGFYQTGDSAKSAVIKVADSFVIASLGMRVVTNWFVADASMQTLTLTNLTAQTNLLLLNAKKEIEVPVR